MQIRIFKARDGDCMLVRGSGGTNVLIDGGRTGSFNEHVAADLGALHAANSKLDLVCVSHIDEDHISGVLRMLDLKVLWKVHRHQQASNPAHEPPGEAEPPDILGIWHNGFSDLVPENTAAILDQLATQTAYLSLSGSEVRQDRAERLHNLVLGEASALRLRNRIADRQLGIPVNAPRDGKVLGTFDNQPPFAVNELTVHLVGPHFDDLAKLRDEWNTYLEDHADVVETIRDEARETEEDLGLSGVDAWISRLTRLEAEIGDDSGVTTPNVASIMFLLEDNGQRALFTGDGTSASILSGLENAGLVAAGGGFHVDVLKVPHHGAAANTSEELTKRVTADHYVFCANGAHHNPDEEVVQAFLDSRLGTAAQRSSNAEAGNPFTMWFTYSADDDVTANQKSHLKKIRNLVNGEAAANPARLTVRFVQGDFEDLVI